LIRGLFSLVLTLGVVAVVYFTLIEPNLDDAKDKVNEATPSVTEPGRQVDDARTRAERFANCIRRDPTDPGHVKRCGERYGPR